MPFISTSIIDNGLNYLYTNAKDLVITSQEVASYSESLTYQIGIKTNISLIPPRNGINRRELPIMEFYDGLVTATGSASFFAIINSNTTELLVTGSLLTNNNFIAGNLFSFTGIIISITDAISE